MKSPSEMGTSVALTCHSHTPDRRVVDPGIALGLRVESYGAAASSAFGATARRRSGRAQH